MKDDNRLSSSITASVEGPLDGLFCGAERDFS